LMAAGYRMAAYELPEALQAYTLAPALSPSERWPFLDAMALLARPFDNPKDGFAVDLQVARNGFFRPARKAWKKLAARLPL
jgi:hypothetical protein